MYRVCVCDVFPFHYRDNSPFRNMDPVKVRLVLWVSFVCELFVCDIDCLQGQFCVPFFSVIIPRTDTEGCY